MSGTLPKIESIESCDTALETPAKLSVEDKPLVYETDNGIVMNKSAMAVFNYRLDTCYAQLEQSEGLRVVSCKTCSDRSEVILRGWQHSSDRLKVVELEVKKITLDRNVAIVVGIIATGIGASVGYTVGKLTGR